MSHDSITLKAQDALSNPYDHTTQLRGIQHPHSIKDYAKNRVSYGERDGQCYIIPIIIFSYLFVKLIHAHIYI